MKRSRHGNVVVPQRSARHQHLTHGEWLERAASRRELSLFGTPQFALLAAFILLYGGSMYLFEHIDAQSRSIYAAKLLMSSFFAICVGFLLSVWWTSSTREDKRLEEARRIDGEYRGLLLNFSDNLFHIINALNTLAKAPPRPFIVATEFLLAEYVGLLQHNLQRYGDRIAGLGLRADDFLDEKVRIFEGIRDRAGTSVRGMPEEVRSLFEDRLHLQPLVDSAQTSRPEYDLRAKLERLAETQADSLHATSAAPSATPSRARIPEPQASELAHEITQQLTVETAEVDPRPEPTSNSNT